MKSTSSRVNDDAQSAPQQTPKAARLAIGAPAKEERDANDDDNEDDAEYVDMTGDEEQSESSPTSGNGRRKSKSKGKGSSIVIESSSSCQVRCLVHS